MELSKDERDLLLARRRLEHESVEGETRFRGVPLERFTAQELIKIVAVTVKYGNVFRSSTKVTKPFKVDDNVYYRGRSQQIMEISGVSASIRQLGSAVTRVVLLKDLETFSKKDK